MSRLSNIYNSLSFRLIFWVSLILLLSVAAWAYFDIRYHKTKALENMATGVERLVNTIRCGTHYAMMLNSRDDITQITQNIARQKDIENIRIYNKEGEIKFSNVAEEVDRTANIKAEAYYICHKQEPPLDRVNLADGVRLFDSDRGYRKLGLISPIYNEPACSADPCHVHPPDKKILGLLDVVVSMESAEREILTYERRVLGLAGGMYVLERGVELDNKTYLTQGWQMIKGNVQKVKGVAGDLLNYAKEREPEY